MIDWGIVEVEYVTGDDSMKTLADKYGVSVALIGQRASDENWLKKRERYRKDRARKLYSRVENDQISKLRKHIKIADVAIESFGAQLIGKVNVDCPHCGGSVVVNIPKTKISASEVNSLIKTRTSLSELLLRLEDREKKLVIPDNKRLEEMTLEELKKIAEDGEIDVIDE